MDACHHIQEHRCHLDYLLDAFLVGLNDMQIYDMHLGRYFNMM